MTLDEPVRRYLAHALHGEAGRARGVSLTMTGRIKVGTWLPFSATETCDGRSFTWHARIAVGRLTVLTVVDRFAAGSGSTEGWLLGRRRLFGADGEDTTRSAAGRAALESVFAPMSLLPERGVHWGAEDGDVLVAGFDVPPERPQLRLRIDGDGALHSVVAQRWGDVGQHEFGYIPCGCEVHAERRFGDVVVPSSVTVGWWFGTPRYAPFFEAEIGTLEAA
jgi:hypothetical protein